MFPEIISPNVKYFAPFVWGGFSVKEARFHDNGVVEIGLSYNKKSPAPETEKRQPLTDDAENLFRLYEEKNALYPVSTTGLPEIQNETVGSYRFCAWNASLAEHLTHAIREVGCFEQLASAEFFAGVSKYFRFMRYQKGGQHFPHFDTDFFGPNYATRYSMVLYFTSCQSGAIAFIDPLAEELKITGTGDWDHQASPREITLEILPKE